MKTSVTVISVLQMDEDTEEMTRRLIPIRTRDGKLMTRRLRSLLAKEGMVENVPDALLDDLLAGYKELYDSIPPKEIHLALAVSLPADSEIASVGVMTPCAVDDFGSTDEPWSNDHGQRVFVARLLIEMRFAIKKRLNLVRFLPLCRYPRLTKEGLG